MSCNCYLFCNKVSSRIVLTSKGFSVFFWITLSHEVSGHFPIHTHTSTYANFKNLLYICCTLVDIPLSLVENPMSHGRRRGTKSWIVSSRLRPYSDFPKHSRKSRIVPCEPNPGRFLIHVGSQICIYNKKK